MITRLFLGLLGVVSAAVAISAATHAVDFADSTVEDGDTRFAIAAVAGAVFVGCVALLVANLRRARRSADAGEGLESLATASPAGRGIAVARPVAAEPSPSSLADRLPGAAGARADVAAAAASRPIFAPSSSITAPGDADGLFEQRTPQRNTPFATAPPIAATPPIAASPFATAPPIAAPPISEPTPAVLPVRLDAAPPVREPTPEPSPPLPTPEPPTPEPTASTPPVARPLTLEQYSADDIDRTVDEQRNAAVDGLVRSGTLTTDGPLTADDIRTMLFIALSTEQLRSMLHDARSDDLPIWVEANDDPPTTGHLYVTGG